MAAPPLHRDDPDKDPLTGNIKVTRQDWLNVALDMLISGGVERVKILTLASRLGVSRSSFYWYFGSRRDLLDALLDHWMGTNTEALVRHADQPEPTITSAVLAIFRCFLDPAQFDKRLDFAVRDWARRDGAVRRVLRQSDDRRLEALAGMFRRYGYGDLEAVARARILYYMQIGYDDADLNEPMSERSRLLQDYILGFTGQKATPQEVQEARAFAAGIERGQG